MVFKEPEENRLRRQLAVYKKRQQLHEDRLLELANERDSDEEDLEDSEDLEDDEAPLESNLLTGQVEENKHDSHGPLSQQLDGVSLNDGSTVVSQPMSPPAGGNKHKASTKFGFPRNGERIKHQL